MSLCEIDSAKNNSRDKRHRQANAGNDEAGMSLLFFRWRCQTGLNAVAIPLAARKRGGL